MCHGPTLRYMAKQHGTTRTNIHEPLTRHHSVADVAKQFGVARTTVHRWIAGGRLTAINIGVPGSPRLRVSSEAVDAFIETSSLDES